MVDSFAQILEIVKNSFAKELSQSAFNLWIAPLKFINFQNYEITLSATDDFYTNIVTSKYGDKLKNKFKDFLGFSVELKILSEKQTHNKNETFTHNTPSIKFYI